MQGLLSVPQFLFMTVDLLIWPGLSTLPIPKGHLADCQEDTFRDKDIRCDTFSILSIPTPYDRTAGKITVSLWEQAVLFYAETFQLLLLTESFVFDRGGKTKQFKLHSELPQVQVFLAGSRMTVDELMASQTRIERWVKLLMPPLLSLSYR